MAKVKKRYLILGGITLVLFVTLFFLSTLVKNYLVNNSQELIGRNLTLEELHINYFKVQVSAKNFTLYEENKKDTFVYFNELLVNYDPWKMLTNEYAVSQIRLVNPFVHIIQNGEVFNFDSMIPPADTSAVIQDSTEVESDVKFSIRNIELVKGEFLYYDQQIDNLLDFDNLNLKLPLIAWNSKNSKMGVEFSIGEQGIVNIDADIDQQTQAYQINFGTQDIQLNDFTNYLKDYVYISELKGFLQSNIQINGSINKVDSIVVSGLVQVDSLAIIDNKKELLVSANSVSTNMDAINLDKMRFTIDKVQVDQPYISAALNKEMSNWEYFLSPTLADTLETETADSLGVETEEASSLYYRVDTIVVNDGHLLFADNTLNRPFSYNIKNINVAMYQMEEQNDSIPIEFSMDFNNDGKYSGKTKFSIANPHKLFYDAKINDLDLHSFSPYTEYYLGYPIISGMFNYDCLVEMSPTSLENNNHLIVREPEFGKNSKDTTAYKVPLKLALYLIKDADDNVEFELPVTGNPSEPGFRLGPLVWKTFGKFLAKTATQPFASLAKLVGTHPEELEHIDFEYTQDSLMVEQRKVLDKVAHILTKKEDLVFSFRQESAVEEEMKLMAEKSVKQLYISEKTPADIETWKDVKDADEKFVKFINKLSPETLELSPEQRYIAITGEDTIEKQFKAMYEQRNKLLYDYLTITKECKESSIKTLNVDFDNMPQDLKKPGFRVEVSIQ
ncbi:DUF748 domain-containing protein [Labilibacter marinus]|uniref:DUF748 domain-containing protein n=1 Tax=Labilibacter marinus TaxID=1477105 RepID=UPI00082EDE49|nr:DUF748 domain-containing protein [Labilibacter marinus]